jgi:hypothetical protein
MGLVFPKIWYVKNRFSIFNRFLIYGTSVHFGYIARLGHVIYRSPQVSKSVTANNTAKNKGLNS